MTIAFVLFFLFLALACFAYSEYLSSKGHNSRSVDAFYAGIAFITAIMLTGIVAIIRVSFW